MSRLVCNRMAIGLALSLAGCRDTAGPPDDLAPESFAVEIAGSFDLAVQGLARFTADGRVHTSTDETPLRADWVELVAAPPASPVEVALTLFFVGSTTAQVRSFTVGPPNENFTFPNSGVVGVLFLSPADGTVADFVSRDGVIRVSGMDDNEIWGDLEVTLDGESVRDGETNSVTVAVTGRFRARID